MKQETIVQNINKRINCNFEHKSPKDFVQSQWQKSERCAIYVFYRWLVACFYIFSVLFSMGTAISRKEFKVYFIYLTNLNLMATMFTTILGAYLATKFYRNKYEEYDSMTRALKIYWFLSISTTMYAILISFIYWAILYHQDNNHLDVNNVIVHITNSAVLIIDIFIGKHCARFAHFVWPLICGIIYLVICTWLYPFFGGLNRHGQNYVYPIMNWKSKPESSLMAAFAVLITGAIIHLLLVCIHKLRGKVYEKFFYKYKVVSTSSTSNVLNQLEAQED